MTDLIGRINAAIDQDEAWALAACKAYPYATDQTVPAEGVSWIWVGKEHHDPATVDPVLSEFVEDEAGTLGVNLATVQEWPTNHRPMRHTYANEIVEMEAAAAGHIVRHDPARVLRQVAAHRILLREILNLERRHAAEFSTSPTPVHALDGVLALAAIYGIEPTP